jgi:hypothetical protein
MMIHTVFSFQICLPSRPAETFFHLIVTMPYFLESLRRHLSFLLSPGTVRMRKQDLIGHR